MLSVVINYMFFIGYSKSLVKYMKGDQGDINRSAKLPGISRIMLDVTRTGQQSFKESYQTNKIRRF